MRSLARNRQRGIGTPLTYGRTYEWRNRPDGDYGYMSPVRNYETYRYGCGGSECREFRQTIYLD